MDPRQEELLSGYLDGELSAEELREVETLLAESAASRQFLEELRAVGKGLRSLPSLSLGVDLSRRVLEQAERQTLAGEWEKSPGDLPRVAHPEPKRGWDFGRLKRPLIWSALTLAAAVLLMVFQPFGIVQDSHVQQVALEVQADKMERGPEDHYEWHAEATDSSIDQRRSGRTVAKAATGARGVARDHQPSAAADRYAKEGVPGSTPPRARESGAREFAYFQPVADPNSASMMVVQCDISQDAAKRREFSKVLLAKSIIVEDTPAEDAQHAERTDAETEEGLTRMDRLSAVPEPGEVDLFFVEATADQLKATIEDMAAQPLVFLNVAVTPAPDVPDQQALTAYNRVGTPVVVSPEQVYQAPAQSYDAGTPPGSPPSDPNQSAAQPQAPQPVVASPADEGAPAVTLGVAGQTAEVPPAEAPAGDVAARQAVTEDDLSVLYQQSLNAEVPQQARAKRLALRYQTLIPPGVDQKLVENLLIAPEIQNGAVAADEAGNTETQAPESAESALVAERLRQLYVQKSPLFRALFVLRVVEPAGETPAAAEPQVETQTP